MKGNKENQGRNRQLEFEGLIAETIDICIRRRTVRRKNLVFTPLRIPGWQTSEAPRYPLAPGVFEEQWIHGACSNIQKTEDDRAALVMTAGYLSELLDFLREKKQEHDGGDNYSQYCDPVIESIGFSTSEGAPLAVFCWMMAQIILEAYESCHQLNDWELHAHLESVLPPPPDLEELLDDKTSSFAGVFSGCLWLLHGWIKEQ